MISIIITTKNEEKNIKNCLCSIEESNHHFVYEILLIDNFSTDKTINIASKFDNLKIYKCGTERSTQRNFGINKSKFQNILFLDADMTISKNLINEINHLLNNNIDALYIPEIITGNSFLNRIRNYERQFYNSTYIDCVRAFKKKVFLDVKGFDESLIGPEDWDFNNKVIEKGFKIETTKNNLFHNEENIKLSKYFQKKNYYSRSMNKYIKKWGVKSKYIIFQLGLFNRFVKIFLINKNYLKIIKNPLFFLITLSLKIIVGILFLSKKY